MAGVHREIPEGDDMHPLSALPKRGRIRSGDCSGQGLGGRLPGQLVAALFRRAGTRVLQGSEHRNRNDEADGRPAECCGDDDQPDRGLGGSRHARRAERQCEEAGRCDVYRAQQPDQGLEDGAILAKNGLKDGDYTIDQLDMGQHVNAITAGTFDGGYTLEPNASMMIKAGVARSLESGVISKYILGDEAADAYAAGCAMTSDFIGKRPEVAKRFAAAWGKAIDFINKNPDEARKYLAKNTFTPDNVVDVVSMLGYVMAGDMTQKQIGDLQKLADFGNSISVVPEKLDVTKVLQKF